MSFFLELEVDHLTEERARAVEGRARARGAWPIRRVPGPALAMPCELDRDRPLLSDQAEWNAPAWALEPSLLPAFSEAIRVLGDELPQGFALRATWVGSKVREERELSAAELAELAAASKLNEFTRYRVPARREAS